MKIRTLIITTALLSSLLGGVAVYLALTVPNDLRADALLKDAREQLAKGDDDGARAKLTQVVQQYPRTDAAAAATVALVAVVSRQNEKLERKVAAVEKQTRDQSAVIATLGGDVRELKARPVPQPQVVAPAPAKKPVVKKAPPKRTTTRKAPVRKKTTTRKRR